jgi:hypothetical protein
MLIYLEKHGEPFGPEEIAILVGAFDKAWRTVVKSGAYLDDQAGSSRDLLAKRIIETAKAGERNERALCDDALAHLTEASLKKMRSTDGRV